MSRAIHCMLNGVSPEQLDPAILVTEIQHHPPELRRTVQPRPGGGSFVTGETRLCLAVTVKLVLKARDPVTRAFLLERLADWASPGGVLQVSDRPDRILQVRCEGLPQNSRDWTAAIPVRFAAREEPWWQEKQPRRLSFEGSAQWYVPGLTPAPISWRVTNRGRTVVTRVSLSAGSRVQTLDGMLLSPGRSLTVTPAAMVMDTASGQEDVRLFLTEDSDEQLLTAGAALTRLALTTDGDCTCEVRARGRFL